MTMAWPAAAQATDYGGGTAPESFSRSPGQLTLVGIRTTANGRVRVHLMVSARCGFGSVRHSVRLAVTAASGSTSGCATACATTGPCVSVRG